MRPANIVTSVSDVLAGIAISGFFAHSYSNQSQISSIILLCISTVGLYGGGVVFNDVFDAELDKIERPERAIPQGTVTVAEASILATILLLAGIAIAFFVNVLSGWLAVAIAVAALVYDKWGKHHFLIGPLNMGLCRGLNLLLGVSIISLQVSSVWYVAFVPIVYIASITMISRGEVHGGSKALLYFAALLYTLVVASVLLFSIRNHAILFTSVFLLAFAVMIYSPLVKAIQQPIGKNIGKAVKAGVIALILLNASWAVAFGSLWVAVIILLLLPVSLFLAKLFAVT